MTIYHFGDRKYISMYFLFVSLQRYEPVVESGNLRVNSSLLAEMSAFCSQVDWEESVSAAFLLVLLTFALSLACVTILYLINRDFSSEVVWNEELNYCGHCFHRFQSGKTLVGMGLKYYGSLVPRLLPAFIVFSNPPKKKIENLVFLNYISCHMR